MKATHLWRPHSVCQTNAGWSVWWQWLSSCPAWIPSASSWVLDRLIRRIRWPPGYRSLRPVLLPSDRPSRRPAWCPRSGREVACPPGHCFQGLRSLHLVAWRWSSAGTASSDALALSSRSSWLDFPAPGHQSSGRRRPGDSDRQLLRLRRPSS